MHLHRMTEWQGGSGSWYCADIEELGTNSTKWWVTARMLNISPAAYSKLLVEKYKVDKISYNEEKDVLVFSWKSQTTMRKFKNEINKIARQKNWQI